MPPTPSSGKDDQHVHWLAQAVQHATASCGRGDGGPFAALVVKEGASIATAWNEVTSLNDPTAHAEIQAIRVACRALGSFQLTGCTLYSSCEPCPMCLGAIYWARPEAVYFAASRHDAAGAGFDDAFIYDQLALDPDNRSIPFRRIALPDATAPFEAWARLATRVEY